MKKGIGMFLAFMVMCMGLAGCKGSSRTESQAGGEFKNGERITKKLTDQVTLDAEIELPESWDGTVETCKVKSDFYDGEEQAPQMFPDIPKEDWQTYDDRDIGGKTAAVYSGKIRIEEDQEQQPGFIYVGMSVSVFTERGQAMATLPSHVISDSFVPDESTRQEFSFSTVEAAAEKAHQYLMEKTGAEEFRFLTFYSVTDEELNERQKELDEAMGSDGNDYQWTQKDCFYDLRFEQLVNGLPLVSDPQARKDNLYVPSGKANVIYSENGIEYVSGGCGYQVLSQKAEKMASMDQISTALERKFKMMTGVEITISEMRLVYYPFPTSANELDYEYELIPAWCFSFEDIGTQQVYINALTGVEIST